MTEKVLITIKGLQLGNSSEDVVEVINIGKYSEVNGKIYIKYDEAIEESNLVSNNLIKIDENCIEIVKKGPISTTMKFIQNNKTMTFYNTPFGNIYLGIFTREIEINKQEDSIHIEVNYSMEMNYEQLSECNVQISIVPQDKTVKLI